jgi:hypothetical protein
MSEKDDAVAASGGNQSHAAEELRVDRAVIVRHVRKSKGPGGGR